MKIIEEETIVGKDLESYLKRSMQFEYCTFKNCDFTQRNLSGFTFLECEFIDSDLSGIELVETGFKEVKFKNCKLLGLKFDQCSKFLLAMNFYDCKIDFSSFYQLSLQKANFYNCSCIECDFVAATLSEVSFEGSDLNGATFEGSNLEKANFSNAINVTLDPEKNQIKGATFDTIQLSGLLNKYQLNIK